MNRLQPIPNTILLADHEVTPTMTALAVELLHDQSFPMGSQDAPRQIDGVTVVARAEWHPPEPAIPHVHRGITLYKATGPLMAEGVDVSGWQHRVDYVRVKQVKQFALMKVSQGLTHDDEMFAADYEGLSGILRGGYHFLSPGVDAKAQADHYLRCVANRPLDLPPILDVEEKGVSLSQVATWLGAVRDAAKRRPIVYTMPSFFDALGQSDNIATMADLWVAHWLVPTPTLPKAWKAWTLWQYSASSGTPGVGPVSDVSRFHGTIEDLAAYCKAEDPPCVSPPSPCS